MNSHGIEVDMAVGKRWLVQRRAGELPRPRRVLVAFIQMNELLVPNEKITDIHVSKCRPNVSQDIVSAARNGKGKVDQGERNNNSRPRGLGYEA